MDDGPRPNGPQWLTNDKGKIRSWKTQAEVLTFLMTQGWQVQPIGVDRHNSKLSFFYMLRRPTR
jgi:hypothetical protein